MDKKRLLSIDFDYFIDTDLNTRNNKFPDGIDEIPTNKLIKLWNYFYEQFPEIKDIGVIEPQFSYIKDYLKNHKFKKIVIADSHKKIEGLFEELDSADVLDVVHIDFHHDNYISGGNKVDCANWLRCLNDRRKDKTTNNLWIRREDSEIVSLMGEFPYANTTLLDLDGDFDYLFICFSPEWSLPHLRKYYDVLRNIIEPPIKH